MIHFEPGIYTAVQSNADRQNGHGQPGIASRVRSGCEGDRGPELSYTVHDFSRERVIESAAGDHPVGHVRDQHGEYPHGQVGEGGDGAVLKTRLRKRILLPLTLVA